MSPSYKSTKGARVYRCGHCRQEATPTGQICPGLEDQRRLAQDDETASKKLIG